MKAYLITLFLVFTSCASSAKKMELDDAHAVQAVTKVYKECLGRRPGLEAIGDVKLAKQGKVLQVRRRLCRVNFKPMKLGKDRLQSR